MSQDTKELKLAVLIDADNVPYSNVKGMMEEIAKYGTLQQSASMPIGQAKCRMENCFVRICNHTNSAIQLYRGKELVRFSDDY
jgi:hypothetical protein